MLEFGHISKKFEAITQSKYNSHYTTSKSIIGKLDCEESIQS